MADRYCDRENIDGKAEFWMAKANRFVPPYRKIPFCVTKASLLVVDMQLFFTSSESHAYLPSVDAVIPNIVRLIERFHKSRRPALFTYYAAYEREAPLMRSFWRDVLKPDSPLTRIDPRLPLSDEDHTIRKPTYSAFSNTTLTDILRKSNTEQVVICGVMTHLCCDTAAREAFLNGIVPFLVADATASVSEQLHLATLISAAHGYAIVTLTEEILR